MGRRCRILDWRYQRWRDRKVIPGDQQPTAGAPACGQRDVRDSVRGGACSTRSSARSLKKKRAARWSVFAADVRIPHRIPDTPLGRSAWQSNAASGVAQPGRLARALTNRGVARTARTSLRAAAHWETSSRCGQPARLARRRWLFSTDSARAQAGGRKLPERLQRSQARSLPCARAATSPRFAARAPGGNSDTTLPHRPCCAAASRTQSDAGWRNERERSLGRGLTVLAFGLLERLERLT